LSWDYDPFDLEHLSKKEELYGKDTKYADIHWENRETKCGIVIQEGTPIPVEIADYYVKNGYAEKQIPLNADTCREIARILDSEADRMDGD